MKVSIEKQSDGTYIAYNITGDKVQIIGTGEMAQTFPQISLLSKMRSIKQYCDHWGSIALKSSVIQRWWFSSYIPSMYLIFKRQMDMVNHRHCQ